MERSNFEMWVLHSITIFHSAEFTLVELLKTAKKHEIHVNNLQTEREVGERGERSFYIERTPWYLRYRPTGWCSLGASIYIVSCINPYPTAFPYGNGMVLHFYQQQESSTTKTVHKVINKGLKTYV